MNTLERLAAALNRLPPVIAVDAERGTITVGEPDHEECARCGVVGPVDAACAGCALIAGRDAMMAGPRPPDFIITDVGLILHRANYEAMVRRQPTHWALRNPKPLDVTRSLWEQGLRGGLSRCRRLASVLAARLVLA